MADALLQVAECFFGSSLLQGDIAFKVLPVALADAGATGGKGLAKDFGAEAGDGCLVAAGEGEDDGVPDGGGNQLQFAGGGGFGLGAVPFAPPEPGDAAPTAAALQV